MCDLLWGCYSDLGGCQGVAMQLQSCSELLLLLWSYKFVIFGCQCSCKTVLRSLFAFFYAVAKVLLGIC